MFDEICAIVADIPTAIMFAPKSQIMYDVITLIRRYQADRWWREERRRQQEAARNATK